MGPIGSRYLSFGHSGSAYLRTHFGQVNCLQSQLPQTFSPIHIGLRGTGDTSTTELRTDSILEDTSMSTYPDGPRCFTAHLII